jgi:hypothetical protein
VLRHRHTQCEQRHGQLSTGPSPPGCSPQIKLRGAHSSLDKQALSARCSYTSFECRLRTECRQEAHRRADADGERALSVWPRVCLLFPRIPCAFEATHALGPWIARLVAAKLHSCHNRCLTRPPPHNNINNHNHHHPPPPPPPHTHTHKHTTTTTAATATATSGDRPSPTHPPPPPPVHCARRCNVAGARLRGGL